jgi:hypothetical protein
MSVAISRPLRSTTSGRAKERAIGSLIDSRVVCCPFTACQMSCPAGEAWCGSWALADPAWQTVFGHELLPGRGAEALRAGQRLDALRP